MVKTLIIDNGFGLVVEVTGHYEVAAAISGLAGLPVNVSSVDENGDDEQRAYGAYFSHQQLLKLFDEVNFRVCAFQVPLPISLFISCP